MNIKINPDFSDDVKYKDDAWRGFSIKEISVFALAFILAAWVIYLLQKHLGIPLDIAPYIAVPLAAPVVFLGLYKYHGMNCFQFLKVLLHHYKVRRLCWDTGAKTYHKEFFMKKRREEGKNKNGSTQCEFIISGK